MASKQERDNVWADNFVPAQNGVSVEMRAGWPYIGRRNDRDYENNPIPPDKQEYEITLFIPKLAAAPWDCPNYMAVANPLLAAATKHWGAWPYAGPSGALTYWPIADCDLTQAFTQQLRPGMPNPRPVSPDYLQRHPWAAGHWRINATTSRTPRCFMPDNNEMAFDADGNPIGFKGGDYCHVSISGMTYSKGSGGITLFLEGVKKTRDGEPVAGVGQGAKRTAQQIFGGLAPVAPALPPQMPYAGDPAPAQAAPSPYGAPQAGTVPFAIPVAHLTPISGAAPSPYGALQAAPSPQAPGIPYTDPRFQQDFPPQESSAPPAGYPSTTTGSPPTYAGAPGSTPGVYPSNQTPAYPPPPGAPVAPPAYPGAGPVAPPAYGTR